MKMNYVVLVSLFMSMGCPALEGPAGLNGLVKVEEVFPGEACAFGGRVISTGLDLDRDGQLSVDEVQSVDPVCNGSPGAAGLHSSYRVMSADRSVELGRSTGVGNWLWNDTLQGYVWLEVIHGKTRFGLPPGATAYITGDACRWGSFSEPVAISYPPENGALIPSDALIIGYGERTDGTLYSLFFRSKGVEDLAGKSYESFGKYPDYLTDRSLCTSKSTIEPIGPMPSPATVFYFDPELNPDWVNIIPVEYDGAPIFEPITLP